MRFFIFYLFVFLIIFFSSDTFCTESFLFPKKFLSTQTRPLSLGLADLLLLIKNTFLAHSQWTVSQCFSTSVWSFWAALRRVFKAKLDFTWSNAQFLTDEQENVHLNPVQHSNTVQILIKSEPADWKEITRFKLPTCNVLSKKERKKREIIFKLKKSRLSNVMKINSEKSSEVYISEHYFLYICNNSNSSDENSQVK